VIIDPITVLDNSHKRGRPGRKKERMQDYSALASTAREQGDENKVTEKENKVTG
jgi:hypothetical protein